MVKYKDIKDGVQDWIEDDSDDPLVNRIINRQLRFVEKFEFDAMRRTVTITPDASGVILEPALCRVITKVYPAVSENENPSTMFYNIADRDRKDAPRTNRYKMLPAGITLVPESDDITIDVTASSATVLQSTGSTGAITADMVGKRLIVEGDSTSYEIITAVAGTSFSVFPSIRRDTGTLLTCKINPDGIKKFSLMTNSGEAYTEDVTVDYQMEHPSFSGDEDELLYLPTERCLVLYSVQEMQRSSKYDVDAERLGRDIQLARQSEFASEVSTALDSPPMDPSFALRSNRGAGRGRGRY